MITNIIRKLPVSAEFYLVILVCFWWGIYGSIVSLTTQSWNKSIYTGIGINLGTTDHEVIIRQVVPRTPAARAELSPGLVIRKVDGFTMQGTNLSDYMDRIRGT